MRVWLLSALIMHQSLLTTPAQAQSSFELKQQIVKVGAGSPSFLNFSKFIQSQVSPDYHKFILHRGRAMTEEKIKLQWLGTNQFSLEGLGNKAQIKVLDFQNHQFEINGRSITLNPKWSPERMLQELQPALQPSRKTSAWLQLLLGEPAYAFNMGALLLGLVVVGLVGYLYNKSNCSQYDSYAAQCDQALQTGNSNVADLYYNARQFDDSWFNLSLGCSDSKAKVKSCIPSLETKINSGRSSLVVQ